MDTHEDWFKDELTDRDEVQGLLLKSPPKGNQHRLLEFKKPDLARVWLARLLAPPFDTWGEQSLRFSIGLSFEGLRRLGLREEHQLLLRQRSPGFAEGARRRAATVLGDSGDSAPEHWLQSYALHQAHGLLSLYGCEQETEEVWQQLDDANRQAGVGVTKLSPGGSLGAPPGETGDWVHMRMRDGLTNPVLPGQPGNGMRMAVGDLLIGFPNRQGANPYLLPGAPDEVRAFFSHGSFAAFRHIAIDLSAFNAMLDRHIGDWPGIPAGRPPTPAEKAEARDWVRAKLLGRWPSGMPLLPGVWRRPPAQQPVAEPDFARDKDGYGCPFGSHIRRMNPRLPNTDAHAAQRPLLRRGSSYGAPHWDEQSEPGDKHPRGLYGMFFCASLETQFEHIVSQWGERPVLGSGDGGSAKDPLIGHHEHGGEFEVPGASTLRWSGWQAHTRIRGGLYLFYPGRTALQQIVSQQYWKDEDPWIYP